jgi:hypothetical protein
MTSRQPDSRIPEAASAWTKQTLVHLNAVYVKETCTNFIFDELGIPSELEAGKYLFGVFNEY